ncbi:unnamed protein product, partial [Sphacelaria rigidula]
MRREQSSREYSALGKRRTPQKGGGMMKSVSAAAGKSATAVLKTLQPKSVGLGEILDTWKLEQV